MPVRGQLIDISLVAINAFYGLPDIVDDGFSGIMQNSTSLQQISRVLMRTDVSLLANWRNIQRGQLTPEAKSWHYFICACLMPTISHSDVQRKRAILTCAILLGTLVNVSRVINMEIKAMLDTKRNRSLGFSVLITHLCHNSGVNVTCPEPTDRIRL